MIPLAPFGRTGHVSSRLLFGAAALGGMSQDKADAVLATAAELGINHIDTAADYGVSEERLAPWLAEHRSEVFLATKTGQRDGVGARRSLETSLARMGVDHVDLIQLHNLVEEDDWQRAFRADGAVAALFAARDEGLCSHVGVTGHGLRIPSMHLRSLGEADFASVLLPYNHTLIANAEYAADVVELLDLCRERQVAVQTIKALARRRWSDDATRRFSWYEPVSDLDVATRAVHYVLANDQVFLNTSSDARLLELTAKAAASFDGTVPDPYQLAVDRLTHDMTPIFDGGALEVI